MRSFAQSKTTVTSVVLGSPLRDVTPVLTYTVLVTGLSSHCPIPLLGCRESQQKVADVFLTREQEFDHHATHILQFDRYLSLLAENCLHSPRLAATVREFEVGLWVL